MKYQLLATDMDGTLLDDKKDLSSENIRALEKAYHSGITVAICTGRPIHTVIPYLSQIDFPCWLITNNGAVIRNPQHEIIETRYISNASLEKVIAILREDPALYFHGSNEKQTYINSRMDRLKSLYRFERKSQKGHIKSFLKAMEATWLSKDYQVIDFKHFVSSGYQLTNIIAISSNTELLELKKSQMLQMDDVFVTRSGDDNLEILDHKATKGNALEKLAQLLKIPREKTVAIGDHDNDISMLTYAGVGIAVENATLSLKKHADLVVCTNNHHAVDDALKELNA
ncbi:hypothetical protein SAMN05192551_10714 [Tindallia magadiensis]|uniref:Cof subfamily of IIB subfamily of haloacid dehalogenase superfamily/HAD-superfamily hydrolase, subfamily IIB n=1 Tax=Tindallia magadiensis TaxID=69895 RepID=A0A1I3FS95_9FIRM|nr:Cof-type HAD-IIB family hydrolase [Tindallia magadiensis]SFI14103.1 hypothetical protein SAMN05192551_10714 [Tindallia magadiensis]